MNSLSVLYYFRRSSINLLSNYVKVILTFIRIEEENFRQKVAFKNSSKDFLFRNIFR